jgi:hypothetical protein
MTRRRAASIRRPARPAKARVAPATPGFVRGRGDLEASLVLIFPLLLAYALGVLVVGRVNGADVVTRSLYGTLGRTAYLLVYAAASISFLLWIRRGRRWGTLRAEVVVPLVLEAMIYAFTLGAVITLVLERMLGLGLSGSSVIGALGAGVHEELVFRLGLFAGLASALRGRVGIVVALAISSLLFAGAHHVGAYGEPFTAHAFAFRTLAGAAFGAIFWLRSLAHAVYAHALYDLAVAWS